MIIAGINVGQTASGKKLRDGGTCIIIDNKLEIAISEERISRVKSDGGFKESFISACNSINLNIKDIDYVFYSSCCESILKTQRPKISGINPDKIIPVPSHHLSHAYSTFLVSPFDEAIIIVADCGGNILSDDGNETEWWTYPREQQSYYVGNNQSIKLIDQDFSEPFEAGIGELYRAFTKFLGWNSYVDSGKTMALAGFSSSQNLINKNLFYFDENRMKSCIKNDPRYPEKMLLTFARSHNIDIGKARKNGEPITSIHQQLASYIQTQIEIAIIEKVNILYKKFKISNLCIAGGVGLNCVLNAKILKDTPIKKIFVQPASSDQGQCLGNALYGLFNKDHKASRFIMPFPHLGIDHKNSQSDLVDKISNVISKEFIKTKISFKDTALLLSQGFIVAVHNGRSEFGPRALGNRSILGDPRKESIRNFINTKIKNRDSLQPCGSSILLHHISNYFNDCYESPYMLLAPEVNPKMKYKIPAVIHSDGTARIQSVTYLDTPFLYSLIYEFFKLTTVPLLLNTSLNAKGQPICETIDESLTFFLSSFIDYIIIDNILVKNPLASDIPFFDQL